MCRGGGPGFLEGGFRCVEEGVQDFWKGVQMCRGGGPGFLEGGSDV